MRRSGWGPPPAPARPPPPPGPRRHEAAPPPGRPWTPPGPPPAGVCDGRAGRPRRHRPDRPRHPDRAVMSPRRRPAAHGPGPAVVRADEADLDVLSQVIADAFHDLAPSRWLITDPEGRRQLFPGYFRLYLEHALASGTVHTTAGRTATALWKIGRAHV